MSNTKHRATIDHLNELIGSNPSFKAPGRNLRRVLRLEARLDRLAELIARGGPNVEELKREVEMRAREFEFLRHRVEADKIAHPEFTKAIAPPAA